MLLAEIKNVLIVLLLLPNILVAQKLVEKPNIILIITDDQRADAMGIAGNKWVTTPNMDSLAQKGVYFTNAFASTPICAASRASILTGTYERNHKYTFQTGVLDQNLVDQAYPVELKKQGYQTAFFGKLGVNLSNKEGLFDTLEDYDRNNTYKDRRGYFYKTIGKDTVHLSRYTGYKASEYLSELKIDKPFFLSVCFSAPHAHDGAKDQYFTSIPYENLLQDASIPAPLLNDEKYFLALPPQVRDGFSRLRWTWRFDEADKYQRMVKAYYNMISEVDGEIGNILTSLKTKHLEENTIVIFMSDNGYFLGERQIADKWMMYDLSTRIPMVIYDPRVKKPRTIEQMVQNVDIPSTILDFAGAPIPSQYQGKSLKTFVDIGASTWVRDTLLFEHLWEFDQIPPSESIRTNKWKYLRYINDKKWEELYDLEADPNEAINLAGNPLFKNTLLELRTACDKKGKEMLGGIGKAPFGLHTETIRDPKHTIVFDTRPEFGWKIPQEAMYQLGYQILVSTDQNNINANVGDFWNSGFVKNNESQNIEYSGPELSSGNTYFWKIRYWDYYNRTSEYSEMQSFKIGQSTTYLSSPNYFQKSIHAAQKSWQNADGSVVYDFGKDAFGTLNFVYSSKKNTNLAIELGEKITEKGSIDSVPGGTIRYTKIEVPIKKGDHNYQVNLIPDKRNTLPSAVTMPDSFPVIMPFRYAQIKKAVGKIKSNDIFQSRYNVYWDESQSSFQSSDSILNQVWDLCKYSIKATSFTGLYIDGDRERIPYEADAYSNQLSHYATDQEYAMARQTIEWFMKHPTWPTEWQQHVALMLYADYMYTGNTELIKIYYEAVKVKTLMDLSGDHGLISSNNADTTIMKKLGFANPATKLRDITDWPPAQKDTDWKIATAEGERDGFVFMPYNTIINSLYYANLKIMAEFAAVLEKTEDQLQFSEAAATVKKALNGQMFDKKRGIYVDGIGTDHASLHANMFALAFDLVPPNRKSSVAAFIKSRGMACSVYGAQYLLEALYNAGEGQFALDLMRETNDRSWYNMIKAGSTITLEAWDIKYKPNLDWNHAWGAVPANMIVRGLWGIKPETPGCAIMHMFPQMGNLESSSIKAPTLRGNILAEFHKISPLKSNFTITVPGNMIVHYYLPSSGDFEILLDQKKVAPYASYLTLEPGVHEIDFNINTF